MNNTSILPTEGPLTSQTIHELGIDKVLYQVVAHLVNRAYIFELGVPEWDADRRKYYDDKYLHDISVRWWYPNVPNPEVPSTIDDPIDTRDHRIVVRILEDRATDRLRLSIPGLNDLLPNYGIDPTKLLVTVVESGFAYGASDCHYAHIFTQVQFKVKVESTVQLNDIWDAINYSITK
jgi:hypothetical protein